MEKRQGVKVLNFLYPYWGTNKFNSWNGELWEHFENCFYVIMRCLHYFCTKSCTDSLWEGFWSSKELCKLHRFLRNCCDTTVPHYWLLSYCGDSWQDSNDTANTWGWKIRRSTLIYNSRRCIKNDNVVCILNLTKLHQIWHGIFVFAFGIKLEPL